MTMFYKIELKMTTDMHHNSELNYLQTSQRLLIIVQNHTTFTRKTNFTIHTHKFIVLLKYLRPPRTSRRSSKV